VASCTQASPLAQQPRPWRQGVGGGVVADVAIQLGDVGQRIVVPGTAGGVAEHLGGQRGVAQGGLHRFRHLGVVIGVVAEGAPLDEDAGARLAVLAVLEFAGAGHDDLAEPDEIGGGGHAFVEQLAQPLLVAKAVDGQDQGLERAKWKAPSPRIRSSAEVSSLEA